MSTEDVKPIMVKKLPLILNRNIIIKKPMNRNIKLMKPLPNAVQEDIIYTSKLGDFTSGEVRKMTIVNRLNVQTKVSQTIAKCQSHSGQVFEKTSDEITKLIGQDNYDILFSSLCSIISQELKIRSINALLTVPKKTKSVSCQTETNVMSFSVLRSVVESSCQTNETCLEGFKKLAKPRKRNRRQQLAPYVVKDTPEVKQPRRIVVSPPDFNIFVKEETVLQKESDMLFVKEETILQKESLDTESSLQELTSVFDEDSNNSIGRLSSFSIKTTPELLHNPMIILSNVDKHTRDTSSHVNQHEINAREQYRIHNLDSQGDLSPTSDKLPFGMQKMLHSSPPEQRIKLLLRQGLTEWKDCLNRDSDDHLPIHVAVLTNDVDLLRRQCFVLKMRGKSVDVTADGLTPLRMSLFQENTQLTAVLLHFGADPLDSDDDDRTPFHMAGELATDHLQILVNHCQQNARKILHENEELWRLGYENKPDEELAPILMTHINKSYDNQGYTPLMLASKVGKYNNVMTLVESCRATVNLPMPNSGNTALYLAVGAACMDAAERGNKAKIVDHFRKTVEILVENGADPNIDNFAGSSVNDLLTEFNIAELSMLIANKLTSIRYFDGQLPNGIKGSDFMLFKDDSGKVNLKEMKDEKGKRYSSKNSVKTDVVKPTVAKTKVSPIIIENVEYKPPVRVNNSSPTVIKSHLTTTPVVSLLHPIKVGPGKVGNSPKQDNVSGSQSYAPIVKNFKLNKPLLITSEIQNNKRKLDIVVDSRKSKKSNKGD